MAGAGFKTFATGEVLTAANVNTYLMQQTVMVFADSAARTTALGANVSEGMLSYLKDTNQVEVYNGSSWVASDDPNAIQNTIVDAKADLITATAADTPARLAVGADGQYLCADSTTSTGLKWTTLSAGGYTELASGSFPTTGTTLDITSISNGYRDLVVIFRDVTCTLGSALQISVNNLGANSYRSVKMQNAGGTTTTSSGSTSLIESTATVGSTADNNFILTIKDYANTTSNKNSTLEYTMTDQSNVETKTFIGSSIETTSAISSVKVVAPGDTYGAGGTYVVYGVK